MGGVSYKLSKVPLINRQSFLCVARCVALRRDENFIKLGLTKNGHDGSIRFSKKLTYALNH